MQLAHLVVSWLLPAAALSSPTMTLLSASTLLSTNTVSVTATTLHTFTTTPTSTTTTTPIARPSPTMPGLASDCDRFHKVVDGDICYSVTTSYGISMEQFYAWNTVVNAECSNLWLGYYVCINVPAAQPPKKPSPLMPGVVEKCTNFHMVKAGDNCWSIYTAAGITFDQFRSWNTAIDASCGNLWPDFYVCIGV